MVFVSFGCVFGNQKICQSFRLQRKSSKMLMLIFILQGRNSNSMAARRNENNTSKNDINTVWARDLYILMLALAYFFNRRIVIWQYVWACVYVCNYCANVIEFVMLFSVCGIVWVDWSKKTNVFIYKLSEGVRH